MSDNAANARFWIQIKGPGKQKKFSDISKYIVALFRRKLVTGRGACDCAGERERCSTVGSS